MFVCHVAYFVIFVSCIREHARSVRDPSWTRSAGLDCVSGGDRYALFAIVLTIVILVIIIVRGPCGTRGRAGGGGEGEEADSQRLAVAVPAGMSGGETLQVQTPSGELQVTIPQGLQAGQTFHFPLSAAGQEAQSATCAS